MKRALTLATVVPATTLAVTLGLAGCTTAAPVARPTATTNAASANGTGAGAYTKALASCGLFPDDYGVSLGSKSDLALVSQPHGKPTDVDAVTARCTLIALGMPRRDGALYDTTTATGGYQTFQWGTYSAALHVKDTLHFEVDVFSTGR